MEAVAALWAAAGPRSSSKRPQTMALRQLAMFSMRSTSKHTSGFSRIMRTFIPSPVCP